MPMSQTLAVYPGSFDPITRGHIDLIERGLKIFGRLVVAVVTNPNKQPLFTLQERVEMIEEETRHLKGEVIVEQFDGLLVHYMMGRGANVILRGLRAVTDFEYEMEMALTNRQLDTHIETVFLTPSVMYVYLRASTVKTIAARGGKIDSFVTPKVEERLRKRFAQNVQQ